MKRYYGYLAQFTAHPGKGEALVEVLLAAAKGMRGNDECLLYLVSRSPDDPDAVWIMEAWKSKAAHDGSLQDEEAREAIRRARVLIASVDGRELDLVGGKGI